MLTNKKYLVAKVPLEHCQEIFNKIKDLAGSKNYGEKLPESFFFSNHKEAADKLEGVNLDFTTFSELKGNYSGGIKYGKKHGFGYFVETIFYESGPGWSSYSEYISSFQVHKDG